VPENLGQIARSIFEDEGLPTLCEYTSIPCLSPAFDPDWAEHGHLSRAAELLASWCRERPIPGAAVEVVQLVGRTPVLIVEVPATDPARTSSTTLLYGHLDKQPPFGPWREGLDPFTATRIGDRLYGRGTADDGYATFASVAAIEALEVTGTSHGRLVILIEASEESGSPDLEHYLEALAERIGTPSLVVCLDSGCVTYDRLWVTTSLRGNLVATVRVDVLDEGVHSGVAGGIVPSSFAVLRMLLDRLEDPSTGELLLDELVSEIPAHRRAEIAAVAEEHGDAAAGVFPSVPGLRLAGSTPARRVERGTWEASLAVTGMDGIPSVQEGGNVLRPSTTAKLSIRLPPNCDAESAARAVERALSTDVPWGAQVSVHMEEPSSGWDAPAPAPWLAEAVEQASIAYFGNPARSMGLGGTIPFMASLGLRYEGVQFLATGVLGPQSNAHGPNEFLDVPTAGSLAAVVAHVLALAP